MLATLKLRMTPHRNLLVAMAFSLVLHAFFLFGVRLVLPDGPTAASFTQPLHVVLVNSKSKSKPSQADALAQHNMDGGGNTAEDRQAKNPFPSLGDDPKFTPAQSARRIAELEAESKRLMTQLKGSHSVVQPDIKQRPSSVPLTGQDMVQRSLEIARLEAQISKDYDANQKMPRRKHIGARTKEYRFAQYIEDWRVKVERLGNLNYPEQARRQQIFGKLTLSVAIRADGSLEKVEVDRSSGHRILDAAAVRIVKLAAPFAPLPANIRRDTDILEITRTWTFTPSDTLEGE